VTGPSAPGGVGRGTSAESDVAQRTVGRDAATVAVGFFIRRLLLVGTHAPTASLEFRRGLNIITGPSDTGKSFALQCIDFAFGASERPKDVPQARTHEWVVLEVESAEGKVFTIERSLKGSPVRWYTLPFDQIRPDTEYEELGHKHSPKTQKTLSHRLLELCALAGRVVRKNKKNATRTLSFRNVVKLIVVDEERVISSKSPALGDHKTDETADKSLFMLLLTGGDESGLVPAADAPERRQRLEAQRDLLDAMLGPSPAPGEPGPPDRDELRRQREALNRRVDELTEAITEETRVADEAAAEMENAHHEVTAAKSRLLVVGELLSRFVLLRQSYETDLERLDFIAEGEHYLAQLTVVTCPACNRPLEADGSTHAFCDPGTPVAEGVQAACAREAAKIRTHLRDLTRAVEDLERERVDLSRSITVGVERYQVAEERIQRVLRPRLTEAMAELRKTQAAHERVVRNEDSLDHRARLLERRHEIERALIRLATAPDAGPPAADAPYQEFAAAVDEVLEDWRYPESTPVTFDTRQMDLVVAGQARATHGKGVRAIMYAAFVIGLMRFCRARGLPHPGLVVLDSPLTAYRKPGARTADEDDNTAAPEDVQNAFFESLAATASARDEQIIVFENKEPPDDVKATAHYVQFTAVPGQGRPGFIPELDI
jgi:hypothetical protein